MFCLEESPVLLLKIPDHQNIEHDCLLPSWAPFLRSIYMRLIDSSRNKTSSSISVPSLVLSDFGCQVPVRCMLDHSTEVVNKSDRACPLIKSRSRPVLDEHSSWFPPVEKLSSIYRCRSKEPYHATRDLKYKISSLSMTGE